MEDSSGLSRWAQCNYRVLTGERGRQETQRKGCNDGSRAVDNEWKGAMQPDSRSWKREGNDPHPALAKGLEPCQPVSDF